MCIIFKYNINYVKCNISYNIVSNNNKYVLI